MRFERLFFLYISVLNFVSLFDPHYIDQGVQFEQSENVSYIWVLTQNLSNHSISFHTRIWENFSILNSFIELWTPPFCKYLSRSQALNTRYTFLVKGYWKADWENQCILVIHCTWKIFSFFFIVNIFSYPWECFVLSLVEFDLHKLLRR